MIIFFYQNWSDTSTHQNKHFDVQYIINMINKKWPRDDISNSTNMLLVIYRIALASDFNEYPQRMFLWRTDENYSSIIIKYPPYRFFCSWTSSCMVIPLCSIRIIIFSGLSKILGFLGNSCLEVLRIGFGLW